MTDYHQTLISLLKAEVETFDETLLRDFNTSFADLGLDSLDVFAFLSSVEAEFGIKIEDEKLQTLTSLQLLEDFIKAESVDN